MLYSSLLSSCVKRPLRTPPGLLKTSYSWATRRFHSVAFRSYCPLPIMIHCHELIPCICYCPPMRILRGRYMNMTRFGCCDEPFVRRSVICTTQLSNESTLVADVMQNVFGMPPTLFTNSAGPPRVIWSAWNAHSSQFSLLLHSLPCSDGRGKCRNSTWLFTCWVLAETEISHQS